MYSIKPDKGQGIVVVTKKDCYDSLDQLFDDPTKFEVLNEDPTLIIFNISKILECTRIKG